MYVGLVIQMLSGDGSCGTPEEPAEYRAIICKRWYLCHFAFWYVSVTT